MAARAVAEVEAALVPAGPAESPADVAPAPEHAHAGPEPEFAPPTPVLPSASSRFGLFVISV